MQHIGASVLYVDQSGLLAGGELNLYDFLRSAPDGASVVLLQDGPFRHLLQQRGLAVTVLPLGRLGAVRREARLLSILRTVPAAFKLRRQFLNLGSSADIIYANSQKAFLLAAASRRRRQPLIWHLHDMLVPEHFSSFLRKAAVFAGNRTAARVIVNSQATAAAFIAAGGRADKVRVVYCGLDPTPFDRVPTELTIDTRASICAHEIPLVGVFGRLAEWKGQHVLLEAVSTLPAVHVAIVGSPLFGEEAYQKRLVERARQPDLVGRVHFLGFREDVPQVMTCVDVIAHTSVAPEPFGRVIVEGMLARKPVIATNAGGAAEIIENGISGLLTSPGSVVELHLALKRLTEDPDLCGKLASSARKRAEELFSLSCMVSGIQEVVAEVAQTGSL